MSTAPSIPPSSQAYNRQMLAQIQALMLGKALDDVAMYRIGERELTKMPLPDLRKWEAEFEKRVRNDIRRQKGLGMRYLPIVFGAAEEKPAFWLDLFIGIGGLIVMAVGIAVIALLLFTAQVQ